LRKILTVDRVTYNSKLCNGVTHNCKLIFLFLRGRHVKMYHAICLFQVEMFYRQARIHFRIISPTRCTIQ